MFSARIAVIILTLCVLALSSVSAQGSITLVERRLKKAKGATLPPKEVTKGKKVKKGDETVVPSGSPTEAPTYTPTNPSTEALTGAPTYTH